MDVRLRFVFSLLILALCFTGSVSSAFAHKVGVVDTREIYEKIHKLFIDNKPALYSESKLGHQFISIENAIKYDFFRPEDAITEEYLANREKIKYITLSDLKNDPVIKKKFEKFKQEHKESYESVVNSDLYNAKFFRLYEAEDFKGLGLLLVDSVKLVAEERGIDEVVEKGKLLYHNDDSIPDLSWEVLEKIKAQ